MPQPDLFSFPSDFTLTDAFLSPDLVVLALASSSTAANRPSCGQPSQRVHSRYRRTLADLPVCGRRVVLRVAARRFFCRQPACPRAVFCERLPGLAQPYARSSGRLTDSHRDLGFALGGEAGARLAAALDMPTSPDTLLRRVKGYEGEALPEPRFVGIDDWAWRKGQVYGTILIDLEQGRVIDIFPGRDGAALTEWLKRHPGVEVITRDRWAAFAQAATEDAPQARQVADRWHLLKNLREAVERLLGRHSAQIHEALTAELPTPATEQAKPEPPSPLVEQPTPHGGSRAIRQQTRQTRQQERSRQFERVKGLRAAGLSLRRIARATGLSVRCVLRYMRSGRCPDWRPGRKAPTMLDPLAGWIDAWVRRGGRNAAQLYRELAGQGFTGSYDAVRRCLARRLGSTGRPGPRVGPLPPPAPPPPPSARKLSFEFIRRPEDRRAEEQARLDKLRGCGTGLRDGLDLAGEFAQMVRKRSKLPLADWRRRGRQGALS